MVEWLVQLDATDGVSLALNNAVSNEHVALTRWLLEHGKPDVNWKNFQGKTALDIASERDDDELLQLLNSFMASPRGV